MRLPASLSMSAVPEFFRVRMAERFPNGHPETENVVKREPNPEMAAAIEAIKQERARLQAEQDAKKEESEAVNAEG